MGRKTALSIGVALLGLGALSALPALAERSGRAGVVVSFDGSVTPNLLPRDQVAPVSITLNGTIGRDDGSLPPRLARIELAFGAPGGLETAGLERCPRGRLRNATSRQALDRCGDALVGRGSISTEVPLSPTEPIQARARLLAFNGHTGDSPAVWVHAYSAAPAVSFVLPFHLSRPPEGSYGILMRAPVGRALGRWPRLRSFRITLGRRYRAGDEARSYLNAECPLPPRFRSLSIPLARATYHFAPRPTIATAILRRCRVRG
jgi:hypothetical protein